MSYDLTGYGLNPREFSSFALEVFRELLRNAASKELMNIACTSMLYNGVPIELLCGEHRATAKHK